MIAAADRDLAGTSAIMRSPASAACSGAPLAWQMATASASAAWSGFGQLREREQRLHHPLHLLLAGAAGAADRGLDLLRAYRRRTRMARWPAARMTTPRAWPTANAERALAPKYRSSTATASGL